MNRQQIAKLVAIPSKIKMIDTEINEYLFMVNKKNEGYFWINENSITTEMGRNEYIKVIKEANKYNLSCKYHIIAESFTYDSDNIHCIRIK
ncbi:hypothetical protein [Klebsiella pneumoniae]|jgi:hypothetical protein|uniref:hypothetical protein n=1 Tax=Klebsiella pneumoniae TaxID=573 RepID=UPI0012798741|nr:hypothetical protein [Klebsiella pneumoniae]EBR9343771.1 hypothetical protein [Salmonella enterica subsp. enterica serovar Schwarzengrund]EDE7776484.1 hypothetical protein [Salmonella enterica subsp. enterica serovar Enteritidis]EGO3727471.1 hypothetical protein [Escherichia coli]EHI1961784.1 hypothetical protein [Salmonella enterica]EBS6537794.1 hypothetical protein [Salmonella enterica subsp. enterica serovar Schwarzengrund]